MAYMTKFCQLVRREQNNLESEESRRQGHFEVWGVELWRLTYHPLIGLGHASKSFSSAFSLGRSQKSALAAAWEGSIHRFGGRSLLGCGFLAGLGFGVGLA